MKKCKYCNGTGRSMIKSIGIKKKFHLSAQGTYNCFVKQRQVNEKCNHCLGTGLARGYR